MKVDKIGKILAAHAGKIEKLCRETTTFFTQESIHQFRVEVKRLRSFLRLLASDKDQPKVKLPKKFKQLYAIAGELREAQLEELKLTEWKMQLPAYFMHLQSQVAHYKQQWREHYSGGVLNQLETELLQHRSNALTPAILHHFLKEQTNCIHMLIQNDPTNENIHNCRKHAKDMLYLAKLTEKEWEQGYKEISAFPLTQLDNLATLLGDYNDQRIMLERLTQFIPTAQPEEAHMIQTLCEEMKQGQILTKKKALHAIEDFLNTAIAG